MSVPDLLPHVFPFADVSEGEWAMESHEEGTYSLGVSFMYDDGAFLHGDDEAVPLRRWVCVVRVPSTGGYTEMAFEASQDMATALEQITSRTADEVDA